MKLERADGKLVEEKEAMNYLGTSVAADGTVSKELGRRLGAAWSEYVKLEKLWKHTTLPKTRKVEVFQAAVISKLLYGLSAVWLNTSDLRRLDGFQARCIRPIVGVKPAYVSRVSNDTVRSMVKQPKLSRQLLKQQLFLFGKIARAPEGDEVRQLTFRPNSLYPATSRYVRKLGRPRSEWATKLRDISLQICGGSAAKLDHTIRNKSSWETSVSDYVFEKF